CLMSQSSKWVSNSGVVFQREEEAMLKRVAIGLVLFGTDLLVDLVIDQSDGISHRSFSAV
ncbi:MAG: hypothetical protein O6944_08045, partial [Gammaproteobacteria bacterium]|nr:hypothetical protein [Gammaproteobacteria bacterium]